jgi:hypothetical protein
MGKWPLYLLYLMVCGLLVAGGFAFRGARPAKESPRMEMIHAAQAMVRGRLVEGLRASFSGEEEITVESLPDKKFMISGWVDLVTEQGRPDRQNYSLIVYKNETGDGQGKGSL